MVDSWELMVDSPEKAEIVVVDSSTWSPLNTLNDAKGAELINDPSLTCRVKARSGASACACSRCLECLAGKCRFQVQRTTASKTEIGKAES